MQLLSVAIDPHLLRDHKSREFDTLVVGEEMEPYVSLVVYIVSEKS